MRIDKDIWAGAFFAGLGATGLYLSSGYNFGTAARMGAGFLPTLLCWALFGLGALIMFTGLLRRGESMGAWEMRPLLMILAAVLVFAALVETLGLIAATIGMTLVAGLGSMETRWLETAALSAGLAAASALIFVKGLGLTIKILPGM